MLVQVFEVGRTCWPGAVLVSNEFRSTTVMPKGYLCVQYAIYHLHQHQLYALRFVMLSFVIREWLNLVLDETCAADDNRKVFTTTSIKEHCVQVPQQSNYYDRVPLRLWDLPAAFAAGIRT